MGKRKKVLPPLQAPGPASTDPLPAAEDRGPGRETLLVFSSIPEFGIIAFCVSYSLFCFNAYLLHAIHLSLSLSSLVLMLGAELALLGCISYKNIRVRAGIRPCLFSILVAVCSFLIFLNVTPLLVPYSWSADYPHHYILIEYLSVHEQLPLFTSGLGEMAQYPFGPSLFTAVAAKVLAVPLMTTMALVSAVIAALLAVTVYLTGRELLSGYAGESLLTDAAALACAFAVFSVPAYFMDQYSGNFYYSMMFGELLVLVSLFALMKVETAGRTWIQVLILAGLGIIFTYTLFFLIPVLVLSLWVIVSPEKSRLLKDRAVAGPGLAVAALFLVFSWERWGTGAHILQHEGLTVQPDILNFGMVFLLLVIAGTILCILYVPGYRRSALFLGNVVLAAEYLVFLVLDQFGIIAVYFANKIFYLFILVLSVSAGLPVAYLLRQAFTDRFRTAAAVCIIGLIGVYSLFSVLTFPAQLTPVVTSEDVAFSRKAETYLHDNHIPYENLSITTAPLKGYWLALLLHMDKQTAADRFLSHATPFDEWLENPDARYDIGEVTNESWPENFEMNGVRLRIVVREGQMVLISKQD